MDFILKNKMQGILTGLIKLYTLKSSRKKTTLIFGQFNFISYLGFIVSSLFV